MDVLRTKYAEQADAAHQPRLNLKQIAQHWEALKPVVGTGGHSNKPGPSARAHADPEEVPLVHALIESKLEAEFAKYLEAMTPATTPMQTSASDIRNDWVTENYNLIKDMVMSERNHMEQTLHEGAGEGDPVGSSGASAEPGSTAPASSSTSAAPADEDNVFGWGCGIDGP